MKKMFVVLLALCMVLTFAPAFAEGEYAVKGIADGDRFAISQTDAATQVCDVYVVNAGATGLTPAAPTGLASADFYVDGELIGSVSAEPYYYPVPIEAGDHTLKVVANPEEGESFDIGTYSYSATNMVNTGESIIETFDGGAEGAEVNFGSMTIAATESCTYQKAPGTDSMAMTFTYDGEHESGQSFFSLRSVPVSASKIFTVDYDFYSENSSGNMISHQLRNSSGSAVVPGYVFGTLASSKYTKDTWHHVSYVFDFDSLTFRGFLDGYEIERGTLSDSANASVRLYLTRYSVGTLYVDNFKACGRVDINDIPEITYAVKGIADGERIPVSAYSAGKRTISIVNADATARAVSVASSLEKADFYIDDSLAGTCEDGICQWNLPLGDYDEHTLKVETTDVAGRVQNFGPYRYRAVYTEYGDSSFIEHFEGNEGDEITTGRLLTGSRIDTFTSTENPVFAKGPGKENNAMKLTSASGKSTNLKTKGDILVPESGFVTYDLDFYSTTGSEYYKLYIHTRNAGGFNMKNGNMTILDNLTMKEVEKNTWHHISYVFDIDNVSYCAFLDGYEFDRGAMANNVAGRTIYFQLQTQSYASGEIYIDNIEIMSKTEAEPVSGLQEIKGYTFENKVVDFDATIKEFTVTAAPDATEGVNIEYIIDDDLPFTGGYCVGSYFVKAILTKEGYNDLVLYALLTIKEPESNNNYDVELIGTVGGTAYRGYLDGIYVIAKVAAGDIDPATQKVMIGNSDTELYYVASIDSFVGVLPSIYDESLLNSVIVVADGPADRIVYGKNPANTEGSINASDFAFAKKLALKKIENPTVKQLLTFDVGNGAMDGIINAADFSAVKKVALKKDADLEINR